MQSARSAPPLAAMLALIASGVGAPLCQADVVTDWDAKASSVASPAALGQREQALVDLSMFDADRCSYLQLYDRAGLDGLSGRAAACPRCASAQHCASRA